MVDMQIDPHIRPNGINLRPLRMGLPKMIDQGVLETEGGIAGMGDLAVAQCPKDGK